MGVAITAAAGPSCDGSTAMVIFMVPVPTSGQATMVTPPVAIRRGCPSGSTDRGALSANLGCFRYRHLRSIYKKTAVAAPRGLDDDQCFSFYFVCDRCRRCASASLYSMRSDRARHLDAIDNGMGCGSRSGTCTRRG